MCVRSLQVCVKSHGVLFVWKGVHNNRGFSWWKISFLHPQIISSKYTWDKRRVKWTTFPVQDASLCLCWFVDRLPEPGASQDWPENIYFTFQFYRFPPVTSQQLRLLTSDKVQLKADSPLPCLLASLNRDGSVNSGKNPTLQKEAPLFLLKGSQFAGTLIYTTVLHSITKTAQDRSHDLECWKLAR